MSFLEGGPFRCFKHGIITENPVEWDNHCKDTGHTQSGIGPCVKCGTSVQYKNRRYINPNSPIRRYLLCERCKKKESQVEND